MTVGGGPMIRMLLLGLLMASLSGCADARREVRVNNAPVSDTPGILRGMLQQAGPAFSAGFVR